MIFQEKRTVRRRRSESRERRSSPPPDLPLIAFGKPLPPPPSIRKPMKGRNVFTEDWEEDARKLVKERVKNDSPAKDQPPPTGFMTPGKSLLVHYVDFLRYIGFFLFFLVDYLIIITSL